MIFWNGNKIFAIIRDGAVIQGCYFHYHGKNIVSRMKNFGGRRFIERFAIVFKSNIVFYNKFTINWRNTRSVERIPIISEFEEIGNFPERFAIRTKNIDLLRELISMGKKVSWLEPDVYTQANFLGILSFEHVFIDPYINTHIIFPTGEVKLAEDVVHMKRKGQWEIKGAKKIGLNLADVYARISWDKYNRARFKRKKISSKPCFIGKEMAINLYNIFSLTYLIWQQTKLNAMTAKKKIVHKE